MKLIKLLTVTALLLFTSCANLQFKYSTYNYAARQQALNIKTPVQVKQFSNTRQLFLNTDPSDFGLSATGNWVHCRHHGFHDLNDWTDFSFSPFFCRPSDGFMTASQWNWNWGGPNHWNNNLMWGNRFNQWGYSPNRWSMFGYDRWGYSNYNWMGNVYSGWGWNNYYGWNNQYRYNPNRYYRSSNINGRRGRIINERRSTRTRSNNVIRTRPTRTTPNTVRPTRTIRTPRTTPNTVRPTRTTPNTVRPVRTQPVRSNSPRINTPSRTSGNTNVIRGSRPSRNNSQSKRRQ